MITELDNDPSLSGGLQFEIEVLAALLVETLLFWEVTTCRQVNSSPSRQSQIVLPLMLY